jgi:hypothetical protein
MTTARQTQAENDSAVERHQGLINVLSKNKVIVRNKLSPVPLISP